MNKVANWSLAWLLTFAFLSLRAGTIFPVDTVKMPMLDCDATIGVCIPLPAGNLQQYMILMDGLPYSAAASGCDFDTTITYTYNTLFGLGNMGPYQLDAWTVNGQTHSGTFQNIPELVQMLKNWDPQGNWTHQPASLSISGGAPGNTYSNMEVTVMVNQTASIIGLNFGLLPQGTELEFSQGTHKIVAWNLGNGIKDTLTVIVECLQLPPSYVFRDTVPADGLPYVLCLDSTELTGTVASVSNACEDASGEYVSFFIDTANFCVKYEPIKCGGIEQACIVVCDDLGICDTTYMVITVDYSLCTAVSHKIMDTLLVNFTGSFCIDTTSLPFRVASVENLCPGSSGESVDFDYDPVTHCVTWTTFMVGQDEACFLLTDTMGNTDTVYFCVVVTLPESGIILDTIVLGQSETYCFDISELAGNVLSIENYCPASSGSQVVFTIDTVGLCLEAQGNALGTDTACIVICDSYGTCDTTLVLVTVVPDTGDTCFGSLPPAAVDDTATTALNTPVNIDILANDTLGNCLPVTLTVLNTATGGIGPNNGLTAVNPDQTVDYLPFADFCGVDTFQYVLCSPVGCDTAMVSITIACAKLDSIIIYNGFSPNGDGTNEVFKIENIERFDNCEVIVYNRWGNLVFQEIGYQNTWDGSYQNAGLPDGTYFYILRLNDAAKREYSGYLQIHR